MTNYKKEEFRALRDADIYYNYLLVNPDYEYKQIAIDFIYYCAPENVILGWISSADKLHLSQPQIMQLKGALDYIKNGYHENISANNTLSYIKQN